MVDTWKSKQWYDVYAPKVFNEDFIGSIPAANPEAIIGRNIETILFYFTDNFADSHIKLKFKITSLTGSNCTTQFIGHDFTRDYSRSLVRRGSTKVTGIFNVTTKDGVVVRVTSFVFTYGRAKASQRFTIRKIMFDVLTEHAKASTYSKFILGMVQDKIAQNIQNIAREIYRIRECKVAKSKLVSDVTEITDELISEEETFEEITPEVKKHTKSVIRKISKRIKDRDVEDVEDLEDEDEEEVEEIDEDEEEE